LALEIVSPAGIDTARRRMGISAPNRTRRRGDMRRFAVLAALLAAVVVALGVASNASADLVTFTGGSCTTGTTTFSADLSVYPAHAFNPLFVTNTDTGAAVGVLVPHTIVLNGDEIVSASPGLETSALSGVLTTCTFQTGRGTFVVTGILAPTIP
jgi:hypothetical protein